ncbi:type III secretion protein SsaJ [Serratia sp. Leaf50]|uniref:type III secretion system inner membrane ring lipoprotein SctJ n=1 Tax=Rouxiella sp. S1S-2 TaxID=2653856 RepID=UPI0006FF4AD8|nr:type III secretion inner membrane ring lipoprotein SctJ [Rouxiella sp. S1S-2]KAB7897040.1 EscJ/YscJ/HrcJ family type III secretion inner membrane ring protein [Rouxiella sp. S1S-2]KQN46470.1 type III secretion protein SsaJ [Serratia sp. Leaf50]
MKGYFGRYVLLSLLALCLTGCKVDLYSGLTEADANQMLALLMLRNIDSEKQVVKENNVTVRVEQSQFVDAVEVLRQHGLPAKPTDSMNEIFPAGQLVTSPVQEQAKINYLKEQLLEKMLRAMDGVVSAQVSIAESISSNRRDVPIPSASVFIKFSPGINMFSREGDIRNLIFKGVPNMRAENISVVLQSTDYRYQRPPAVVEKSTLRKWAPWIGVIFTLLAAAGAFIWLAYRRRMKTA